MRHTSYGLVEFLEVAERDLWRLIDFPSIELETSNCQWLRSDARCIRFNYFALLEGV